MFLKMETRLFSNTEGRNILNHKLQITNHKQYSNPKFQIKKFRILIIEKLKFVCNLVFGV